MGNLVRALLVAALLASCGSAPSATPTPTLEPSSAPTPTPTAQIAVDLALGPWRSHPIPIASEVIAPLEAACREAEPAIGDLPLAVADLRGVRLSTLVFGDDTSDGYACRMDVESPSPPIGILALDVPDGPADGIDTAWYGSIVEPDATRMVAIGRVGPISQPHQTLGGPIPSSVVAGLDGERFVWATYANGWYALWWPTIEPVLDIAVLNSRNEVLDSVEPQDG
jgi:hypothetical protein